ncbi:MAG TPA: tautomerase family protein [Symbiobacteriaceae bacterium]|nr:tautomerase family protein [Symbiobacteriaceae bacterium]
MPFVRIHAPADLAPEVQQALVAEVRTRMGDVLGSRPQVGQVVLYTAPPYARAIHETRDNRFVYVEVLMWSGRPPELKQTLLQELKAVAQRHTGVPAGDIIGVIVESHQENWAGG